MFIFNLLAVLVILYYGVYYYLTRTFNYWKKRNVPGPKPIALFGNIKDSVYRQKNMAIVIKEACNMFPDEKVIGIYRMTTPCLVVRDLDILKNILIKDFHLFQDRGIEFSNHGLGQNLFHADGDTWNTLRTRFTPIFTSGKLKNMFHLLNDRSDLFIKHLTNMHETKTHDINSLVQKYTVSSIFSCAFGIDFDNFETELDDSLKTLDKLVLTPNYAFEVDMMFPGLLKKLDLSVFPTNVKKFFDDLVAKIITERNGKPSNRGDFMDLILQLREQGEINSSKTGSTFNVEVTADMIAAQAFVFYVAGYETSSTTMTFLLYEIAKHPEIQNKLREEIDNVLKTHGKITYESVEEMKYLKKAFLETLRFYPVLDPLQRKALVDYKIPGTDLVIKKDQLVLVPVLAIHHDEKIYPNPGVFNPNRFDADVVGERHPCAHLPFGVGPRNCIGLRFGSLQSRLLIAKLLSKFRVETCYDTPISLGINPNRLLIGPGERIFLKILPRNS